MFWIQKFWEIYENALKFLFLYYIKMAALLETLADLPKITDNSYMFFLIGILSFFPSIAPSIITLLKNPSCENHKTASLEMKIIYLPLFYGLAVLLLGSLISNYFPHSLNNYVVFAFLMALFYPTLGAISGYAKKMYGTKSLLNLYLGAQFMYLPFFGIFVPWITEKICPF